MKTLRQTLSILTLTLATSLLATGCLSDGEQIEGTQAAIGGRPYFEVFKSDSGSSKYYFRLKAANHETILSSQGYSSRTAALGGVLSVEANAGSPERFELLEARNGQYYFNLKAANGHVIGTSELYSTKSNATAGTEAVTRNIDDYLLLWATRSGARFDVSEGADGRFYFNLRAGNGEIVLQSQGYAAEASALNGTFSVSDNGENAARYDLRESANGGVYFNLKARNGQIIATSEVYSTKSNATRAVNSIIALLPDVELL